MPSYAENLVIIRDNVAARLAEITASPKPSYSVEGQSFSWTEYQSMLFKQLESANTAIAAAEGPFEIMSEGIV